MKKTYSKPTLNTIKCRRILLLLNYSATEAASDAVSLGRELDFEDDGEY